MDISNLKILYIVIFIFFMKNGALAQIKSHHITGIISNRDTKELVSGATIILDKIGTSDNFKSISDAGGNFSIAEITSGSYRIKISCVGFNQMNDTIAVTTNGGILKKQLYNLVPINHSLETVNIGASVTNPFILFSKGKILLDVQSSPLAVGSSVYDVLLRAPGVTEQNEKLSFRMKTVNVLINGRPSNLNGSELKAFLTALSSSQVSKIEVIPNPSAKYDSQGGSVINILLKRNDTIGLNGSGAVTAGAGRYFRHTEGLNLNYGTKKLSVYGSYDLVNNKQYSDSWSSTFFEPNTTLLQSEHEIRRRTINTFRSGIDYDISEGIKAGAQFRGFWTDGEGVVNNVTESRTASSFSRPLTQTNSNAKLSSPYVNAYLDLNIDSLGKKLTINADIFHQGKRLNDEIMVNGDIPQSIRGLQPADINTQAYSADYTNPLLIGKIEAGFKVQSTTTRNNPLWEFKEQGQWVIDPGRTYRFKFRESIYSAYLNWNTIFFNKLDINTGLRAEKMVFDSDLSSENQKNKRTFSYLFPTINIEYALSSQNILNANYRKNLDRFGFNIVNPFKNYVSPYFSAVGNPDIKPQVNHDMEVTYTYRQSFVFGVSYTRTKDVISPIYISGGGAQVISTYDNLPSSDLFYVFANVPYRFFSWWSLNFSGGYGFYKYNTQDLQGISANKTWSYLAQMEMYFNLGHEWKIELSGFSRGAYTSGIYRAKGVSTVSGGVKKGFSSNKLVVSANVTDWFNSKVNAQTMDYRGITMDTRNKAETRFVTVGAAYTFGSKKKRRVDLKEERIKDFEKRM